MADESGGGVGDLEDILRDAGYEIAPVPKTTTSYGCTRCGDPHAETVNGCCIVCAAKDAPTYWDGDETDG